MFNGESIAYFATIRKTTAAFGTLFDQIYISRYSENGGRGDILKTIKVPLSYAATEKWLSHKQEDVNSPQLATISSNKKIRLAKTLPRISFEMVDIQYDPSRKLSTLGYTSTKSTTVNSLLKQLNPVPYDYSFQVNIATKTLDDGFQIIEQILPNFTPSFNLTIKDIPELNITRDVPVIFGGISKQDIYEGSYENTRILQWTLTFIVKGYLYPNIHDVGIIKKVINNIQMNNNDKNDAVMITKVNPLTADADEEYTIDENIFEDEQLDSNGEVIEDSNG
jgi:hypothetical protein